MKHIILSLFGIITLSSCSSFMNQEAATVETSFGFELSAEHITYLGVANALAKKPETYEHFVDISNTFEYVSDEEYIDADVIRLQIDGVLETSCVKNRELIASSFETVLRYFDNKDVDLENISETYKVFCAIKDGLNLALEHHILSQGEVTKQVK